MARSRRRARDRNGYGCFHVAPCAGGARDLDTEGSSMGRPATTLIIVGALIAPLTGRTQSPSLVAARLHASVGIDSRGTFIYRYTVENGAGSTAGIWTLAIDISLPMGASRAGEPVGLSAPEPGWRAIVGTDATAHWEAIRDASAVLPKHTLAGFSMTSHDPPALGRFTLSPHIDPDRAPIMSPGDDPGDVDRYNQDLARYVESQSVEGVTLTPATAVTVTPDAVLANLTNQVVRARSLGWISDDSITRSLRAKLEPARAAFSRRQFEIARNILSALRNEVAAQAGKSLTAEAVALLDVNIQYVLQLAAKR
jgi:hypothetical protein